MYLDSTKKEEIFSQYGQGAKDTGSAESQIALFTYRIKHLTEHMKQNRKDHSTERALTGLVGKRRSLLEAIRDTATKTPRPAKAGSHFFPIPRKHSPT